MIGASLALTELLAECDARGIRLSPDGDEGLSIDAPQNALTPDLLARLKAHKADVLALLRPVRDAARIDLNDAAAVWQAAVELLQADPSFPPDLLEALRAANLQWANDELVDEPGKHPATERIHLESPLVESIDVDELAPCSICGTLELWQTLAGNWRCLHCDPPTTSRRLAALSARIRRRTK